MTKFLLPDGILFAIILGEVRYGEMHGKRRGERGVFVGGDASARFRMI